MLDRPDQRISARAGGGGLRRVSTSGEVNPSLHGGDVFLETVLPATGLTFQAPLMQINRSSLPGHLTRRCGGRILEKRGLVLSEPNAWAVHLHKINAAGIERRTFPQAVNGDRSVFG